MLTDPLFWLLGGLGVILTGISKSGFAGGAGVVAVPLLALIMPLPQAAALMLPVLLVMDAKTVHYYFRHAHWPSLKALLPAACLGIGAGALGMGTLSDAALQLSLALLCIVFGLWAPLSHWFSKFRGAGWVWGAAAGTSSTLIHAGGPPLNIYLLGRGLPKLQWLATASIFFAVLNVIKILPYGLLGQWQADTLSLSLALLPLALLGVWAGKVIAQKIDDATFMNACRGLLIISGLLLLAKAGLW
ncbi:sulfite exporter TauE/SafE family protein [Simiduia sp. 21SJ11W-1]|uniref:sulfite exporter TauE/SafE family protein n=1 Tax=Simiduia sp. 21SJ11W-1 TaxID=2909669 RepID=UPI00209E2B7E|nr:sulfite exporter TauE/SafE family protein [Simiduia sp. 21SJ11W-1]UTA47107.1 sulfite exporter TauE/SafE family protein [Simiduia sp. 21SJ11W-1]